MFIVLLLSLLLSRRPCTAAAGRKSLRYSLPVALSHKLQRGAMLMSSAWSRYTAGIRPIYRWRFTPSRTSLNCIKRILKLEMLQSFASEWPRICRKRPAIHYLNACHSGKSRSMSAKKQSFLPHICHSAKYERSSSVTVVPYWNKKPNNRSRCFDLFAKVKVTYYVYPERPFRFSSCMTVHNNVAVDVIVSEIMGF